MDPANPLTYFAETDFRAVRKPFGIKRADRFSHVYIIGKTGTGKSTLLETIIRQDIHRGEGIALIDPHGDLVERIAQSMPEHRQSDVIYFNVPDPAQPYGYNPLRRVRPDKRILAASGLLEVFHKMWGERAWGARMEHIFRNVLLALLDQPGATLADVLRLLDDRSFRRQVAANVRNSQVRDFWLREYKGYSYRYRAEAIAPIQNKVGAFLADPNLRRILTRPQKMLSFRQIMDERKILLVNLARGRIGEDSAALLGGLLVTTIGLAAYSRAELPEPGRRDFYLFVDEFQSFTTLSVANMISELRKYRVGLIFAHQYLYQLEPDVRYAVLGNAGTIIAFRVGAQDAPFFAREFEPKFGSEDLVKLPNYRIYLKLLIDSSPSKPFSAVTLRPGDLPIDAG